MTKDSIVAVQRRNDLLEPICDYLLRNGLDAANLRALARAAGTSNRMLLYYFNDKDDLIAEALKLLGARLANLLAEQMPDKQMKPRRLADSLWAAVQTPDIWPYMVLFIEIIAKSGRTGEPYSSAAKAIAAGFVEWVASRLIVAPETDLNDTAREVLSVVDGRVLLRMANTSPSN